MSNNKERDTITFNFGFGFFGPKEYCTAGKYVTVEDHRHVVELNTELVEGTLKASIMQLNADLAYERERKEYYLFGRRVYAERCRELQETVSNLKLVVYALSVLLVSAAVIIWRLWP